MRNIIASLLFVVVSLAVLSAQVAVKAAKPPKKITLAEVDADNDGNKPVKYSQSVDLSIKNLPQNTDLKTLQWEVVVSYDNAPTAFFRSSAVACPTPTRCGGTWMRTVMDTNGQELTPEALPPAPSFGGVLLHENSPQELHLYLPDESLTDHTTSMLVSVSGAQILFTPTAGSQTSHSFFESAPSQAQSDNYLTGSYSPAIHSAPQYTISGQGRVVKQLSPKSYFGAVASVETDNRPEANPDSFLVSGLIQSVPIAKPFWGNGVARGMLIDWDVAGLEFDRQTTTETFISSALAEVPLRLYPNPGENFGKVVAALYPEFGLTIGTNLTNALEPSGSGFVFRGLAGGKLSLTLKPGWKWLQQIGLTGNDIARIPATNEIFTYTHYISATQKTVSLPVLSTKVRNHVTGQLAFTFAKPFSLTVKYEDGELPPAFKTINNKVTIGLSITLRQRTGASTKVDPEKQ